MPRKKNEVPQKELQALLALVRTTGPASMDTVKGLAELSRDISLNTGEPLSTQTLRRLFGPGINPFAPSAYTLDVLSRYTGYQGGWEEFRSKASTERYLPLSLNRELQLYKDFYNIPVQAEADMNYHNACRNIALRVLLHPPLLRSATQLLVNTNAGRRFFFSKFPYIDGLCGEYRRYLHLFLQRADRDGLLFGQSLLCLACFLEGDGDSFQEAFRDFQKTGVPSFGAHPFLVARYDGTRLLHAFRSAGAATDRLLDEIRKNADEFAAASPDSFWRYDYYQHLIGEYLLLTGHLDVLRELLARVCRPAGYYRMEQGYVPALELLQKLAQGGRTGLREIVRDERAFAAVHPLFRYYFELLVLKAAVPAFTDANELKAVHGRIAALVAKTGFQFFS